MGCGTSRNVVVPESVTIEAKPTPGKPLEDEATAMTEPTTSPVMPPSPTPSQKSTSSRISIRSRSDRPKSRASKSSLRQKFERIKQDSGLMGDADQDKLEPKRETSAGSQESGSTIDSGYSDESPNMITEYSKSCDQEIAGSIRPTTPELSISGTGLMSARVSSATTRHLQKLKVSPAKKLTKSDKSTSSPSIPSSSLSGQTAAQLTTPPRRGVSQSDMNSSDVTPQVIQRPASRGGMAFDIQFSTPNTGNIKRTPGKLVHLDRRTRSVETLRQDIEERMKAAEERRKEKERRLVDRLEKQNKESSVQSALDEFAKSQMEMSQVLETKMTAKTENREAHFKILRERLQAQKEKAEKVRLNKKRAPPSSIPLTAE